ncbi:hypothetical protein N9153_01510 [Planctomicrobium sp.]|nr:hypothetical protein [Planctomicrobium sp.]MDB4439581.1 hypothetical protein [Planctomicrobium sp.]MDB4731404.1 hypothetical protein [bacterium]
MNESLSQDQSTSTFVAAISNGPLVFSVALVICAWMISSSIKSYGESVEIAASRHRTPSINIPSNLTIRLESGNSPIRIQNQ